MTTGDWIGAGGLIWLALAALGGGLWWFAKGHLANTSDIKNIKERLAEGFKVAERVSIHDTSINSLSKDVERNSEDIKKLTELIPLVAVLNALIPRLESAIEKQERNGGLK